ncbi:hypothetical protein [Blautia sp. An46]|uniref:hypothetical protein n=1 Tax=Blautia sp. An46 TaxID=1965636 RepID=UPI000B3ABFA5|nr:hypothetical protein [Blautia sp. An46]OUN92956.1 hypothetical protein B5G00_07295 [Blautia sp. An46]
MHYSIAKLDISIDPFLIDKGWSKFITYESSDVVQIKHMLGREVYNINEYYLEKDLNRCYRYENDILLVNNDWSKTFVFELKNKSSFNVFTNLIFYTHAVQRHMIQIHSSMIDYRGKGLLFLGPSGIGKTTMAELWNQYRDALIINGDMNFVQDTGDEFIGWGTPWHGSSPYCENTSVPIQSLIILKQASENYIRELSGFEKVQLVSNNIIYPTWLENGMELCLETLDHLLTKLPVYELSCRPDEDAVKLTEETIFGK